MGVKGYKMYLSQMQNVFVRHLIMMLMLGLSGSYQVSGWAVNGRELAGTPTHPPFFSDQHCDDRDDIDDHHLMRG